MDSMKQKHHTTDFLFILTLFGLLTLCSLCVMGFGLGIYRNTAAAMEENSQVRTSLTYVAEKLRQNDREGGVSLGEIDNTPALILHTNHNDVPYCTYIYFYQGGLRELMTRESEEPAPYSGQIITEAEDFQILPVNGRLYECILRDTQGKETSIYVTTKCR